MRKYAPAIAILALMAIVYLVAIVAPQMTTMADKIALWLLASGCMSIPAVVLWQQGADALKPAGDDDEYSEV